MEVQMVAVMVGLWAVRWAVRWAAQTVDKMAALTDVLMVAMMVA